MNSTDRVICVMAFIVGLVGSVLCYFLMTIAFDVSPWISIPIGFVSGVMSPFIGEGL
jgi:hypothetical protein